MLTLSIVATPADSSPSAAPTGTWADIAPRGVQITALEINPANPSIIYAGIVGDPADQAGPRVYRSTDAGQSWTPSGNGLPADPSVGVVSFVFARSSPSTVFALDFRKRLFRSVDSGVNWTRVDSGPVAGAVISFAIHPETPSILYIGTGAAVFKSVDGGATWAVSNTGLPQDAVTRLTVDAANPNIVTAYMSIGAYRSIDAAASWQPYPAGNVTNPAGQAVPAVDAAVPTTLYVGSSTGAFRSVDSGQTWTPINSGLTTTNVTTLVADRTQGGVLFAATIETQSLGIQVTYTFPLFHLHRSTDGGTTWTPVLDALTRVTALVARDGAAYVGTPDGVYRSPNGTNWALSNQGLPRLQVMSVFVGSTNSTVYAGVQGSGVWRSTDRGETWIPPNASIRAINPTAFAQDPSNPTILYVATLDDRNRSGIQKSVDGGITWAATGLDTLRRNEDFGKTVPVYSALMVHPAAPSTVYAGGYENINGSGTADLPVLMISENGGTSWNTRKNNLFTTGRIAGLALPPGSASTAYAGTSHSYYQTPPVHSNVWKTTNSAFFWEELTPPPNGLISSFLVIDPSAPMTLYAGRAKTIDGGQSWTDVGLPPRLIDPTTPTTLYSTSDGGVFKSTNGGQAWAPLVAGGTATLVSQLALDPQRPSVLYAVVENHFLVLDQALVPPTPTPTTVPALCAPRPKVKLVTQQTAPGTLSTEITLEASAGTPNNTIQQITFDSGSNVTVETPGSPPRPPGFAFAPGAGQQTTFIVRRVNSGPFTVRLTVTDACGPWPTFVGGGAGVP